MSAEIPAPVRVHYRKGQKPPSPNGLPTVYVGRPTAFGNPFRVGSKEAPTRRHAVELFEAYIASKPQLAERARHELKGKNLACWCPVDGKPCHAATLLRIANSGGA